MKVPLLLLLAQIHRHCCLFCQPACVPATPLQIKHSLHVNCMLLQVAKNLDAATTIPNCKVLPMHNEMSYNPRPVNKIMLLCIEAAERGGENLVAKNSDVLSSLPQSVLDSFEEKGGVRWGPSSLMSCC